ncbi:MAG: hypothetical protein HFE95_00760 [Acutalibacter sp.]|nr:hypothetical protein [Acutalibacter sp.]
MAEFSKAQYRGHLIRGDLLGAIRYIKQFPEQAELAERYRKRFEGEEYAASGEDAVLEAILSAYRKYYRETFYLGMDREKAEDRLSGRLARVLGAEKGTVEQLEEKVAETVRGRGLYFLGGRTSGWYGPYIWKTMETKTYQVELPEGVQAYSIRLLDGFLSRSWLDDISFGKTGTGGWTDKEGTIHCVRAVYDLDSEDFQVSLLKHEAQHARDLARDKNMPSAELEYRAKLVELIYSNERDMLGRFAQEADSQDRRNGHAAASGRIVEGFAQKLGMERKDFHGLARARVQAVAGELFAESGTGKF